MANVLLNEEKEACFERLFVDHCDDDSIEIYNDYGRYLVTLSKDGLHLFDSEKYIDTISTQMRFELIEFGAFPFERNATIPFLHTEDQTFKLSREDYYSLLDYVDSVIVRYGAASFKSLGSSSMVSILLGSFILVFSLTYIFAFLSATFAFYCLPLFGGSLLLKGLFSLKRLRRLKRIESSEDDCVFDMS